MVLGAGGNTAATPWTFWGWGFREEPAGDILPALVTGHVTATPPGPAAGLVATTWALPRHLQGPCTGVSPRGKPCTTTRQEAVERDI